MPWRPTRAPVEPMGKALSSCAGSQVLPALTRARRHPARVDTQGGRRGVGYTQRGGSGGARSGAAGVGAALRTDIPSGKPRVSARAELPDGDRAGQRVSGARARVGGGYRLGELLQPSTPPKADVAARLAGRGQRFAVPDRTDAQGQGGAARRCGGQQRRGGTAGRFGPVLQHCSCRRWAAGTPLLRRMDVEHLCAKPEGWATCDGQREWVHPEATASEGEHERECRGARSPLPGVSLPPRRAPLNAFIIPRSTRTQRRWVLWNLHGARDPSTGCPYPQPGAGTAAMQAQTKHREKAGG